MLTICKRELAAAYHSFIGWLIALTILLMGGIFTWVYCCLRGSAQFEYVIASMELILILVVPVLSMRTVAEERKQRTDQLLYSLPVRMSAVVLGKFLAMLLCYFLSPLAALMGDGNALLSFLSRLMEALSLFEHQTIIRAGLFDLGVVVYYSAAVTVFLALTILVMEKRRWNG